MCGAPIKINPTINLSTLKYHTQPLHNLLLILSHVQMNTLTYGHLSSILTRPSSVCCAGWSFVRLCFLESSLFSMESCRNWWRRTLSGAFVDWRMNILLIVFIFWKMTHGGWNLAFKHSVRSNPNLTDMNFSRGFLEELMLLVWFCIWVAMVDVFCIFCWRGRRSWWCGLEKRMFFYDYSEMTFWVHISFFGSIVLGCWGTHLLNPYFCVYVSS